MQGIESLNNFKSFVSTLGGLGRFEDTYMIHAAEGETVVPMEVLNSNPLLKERLFESMRDMGIQPERYVVGNKFNSINPITGQPEFFLKKIISQIRKAMPGDSEKYLGAAVGALTGNPFYGALAGGVGSGTSGALTGGAAGAMLPGFNKLGGQAAGFTDYLKGMNSDKLFSKAGSYLVNPMGRAQDFIGGVVDRPFSLPSKIIEGVGKLGGGIGSFLQDGYTGGTSLLGKLTGGDQSLEEYSLNRFKKTYAELDDIQKAAIVEEYLKGGGKKDNTLLKALLGLGGTLGLGSLIGEPEDITVDQSKMRVAPINTGQVFNPNQPVTMDTGYNVPITPYQAAEGGIIGYNKGGFSGSPHTSGPMYTGEDEGDVMPKGVQDELLRYLLQKFLQEQQGKIPPFDPNAPIEVAGGGVMDLRKGGASNGPGTGTSDSIPAMLSDGEFVMTAKAVRGAGEGDRREGARKMYEAMNKLETQA